MARTKLSIPVSLILIVVGVWIIHLILGGSGWHWHGSESLTSVWARLPASGRGVIVLGLILNAYGFGALIDALVRRKQQN